jgi:hypothetical protein
MIKHFRLYFLLAIIATAVLSCRKGNNYGVPLVRVNETIFVSNPAYINLSAVGGWIYYPAGSRGLIVYRSGNDEFNVYDRHTTYQPEEYCDPVYVDSSTLIIKDHCSDSEWIIVDGSVVTGPTSFPLKQYQTSFDGSALHVFN